MSPNVDLKHALLWTVIQQTENAVVEVAVLLFVLVGKVLYVFRRRFMDRKSGWLLLHGYLVEGLRMKIKI